MAVAAQIHQPGTSPMMMGISGQSPAALADAEGRYSIQGLSPGVGCLEEMFGGIKRILKSVQVAVLEEETQHIEIDLASGQQIFGTIQGGSAEADYQILVRRPGGIPPQTLSPFDFAQISIL